MSRAWLALCWVFVLALSSPAGAAGGDAADAGATDAGATDAGAAPPTGEGVVDGGEGDAGAPEQAPDPETGRLVALAEQVRELGRDELDAMVDPQSLFETDLEDERATTVEARRLAAVLAEVDAMPPLEAEADAGTKKPPPASTKKKTPDPLDAGLDGGPDGGDAEAPHDEALDARYEARIDLDRARFEILSLPSQARAALLAAHAERRKAAEAALQKEGTSATDEKAEQASADRDRALEEMRRAQSEAEKLVAEERARLLGVKQAQAEYEGQLIRDGQAIDERSELTLAWRRRVTDHVKARREKSVAAEDTDTLYVELIALLRSEARSDLSSALDGIASGESSVPSAGKEQLDTAGAQVERAGLDALHAELAVQEAKLVARERKQRDALAKLLMDQVESLNRDRLTLYPYLSAERRDELTGFNVEGIAQAKAELTQVAIVVRYHVVAAGRWIQALGNGGVDRTGELLVTVSALKIIGLLIAFLWWRRGAKARVHKLHELGIAWLASFRRSRLAPIGARLLRLLPAIRGPLEWLLLAWLVMSVLGDTTASLLEVRVPWIVLSWTFGGVIAVHGIDALVATTSGHRGTDTAVLRLRSLRLLGRVTVAVGLTLALSGELVGEGTIYSWVWSSCWLAALPILLVIVSWWRPVIFERIATRQKRSAFARWALSLKDERASFLAATLGGAYLIGVGAGRLVRGYVTGFNLTRRLLAYWFRREISKQTREGEEHVRPLDPEPYASLDPEGPSDNLVTAVGDKQAAAVIGRIDAPGGGVFAVVGERGAGKSTLLNRTAKKRPGSLIVECPPGGLSELRSALRAALGLPEDADDAAIREQVEEHLADKALIIDDAQRLVQPTIGGLADLDEILALARESCAHCTWIFAVGWVTWRLVERARGARPLFDDVIQLTPWSEENIAEVLKKRSLSAGLRVRFDDLVVDLEAEDEIMRAEQLHNTETSYYRLLWDYAMGNPAVALHFWRESLRMDEAGDAHVQLFSAPDTHDIERMPDPTVFVLRAVIALEWATEAELVAATNRPPTDVANAIRYARFRGYLEKQDDRYRIHWTWFRAITGVLERRHLLRTAGT